MALTAHSNELGEQILSVCQQLYFDMEEAAAHSLEVAQTLAAQSAATLAKLEEIRLLLVSINTNVSRIK